MKNPYKWIETSPGHYKLVDRDDPRPEKEPQGKSFGGSTYVKFSPSWRKYEGDIHNENASPDAQAEAADKFVAEREHQMKIDPRAASWEKSRKESLAREKPIWRREMLKRGIIQPQK